MTEAPERIWRVSAYIPNHQQHGLASWADPEHAGEGATEYVRKDVSDALVAAALREAAAVSKEIADQYVGYMSRIEQAILALITKDADNG